MKIIVLGTGEYYRRYKGYLSQHEVVALADNNEKKHGVFLDDKKIISVKEALTKSFDKVLIMNRFVNEMTRQLVWLGVNQDRILYPYDIGALNKADNNRKRVLVISDDLKRSGAQIAILHAAEILKNHDYLVTVASPCEGPLVEMIWKQGIPLVIDPELAIKTFKELPWTWEYDLIIINTVVPYYLMLDRDTNIPVIWWLHECDEGYHFVFEDHLKKISSVNLYVFGVSDIARNEFNKRRDDIKTKLLPIGVPMLNYLEADNDTIAYIRDDTLRIAVVGEICPLKGQDILFKAIERLSVSERKMVSFVLAGRKDNQFAEIRESLESLSCVELIGDVSREEMDNIYRDSDLLICCSRMECLPTTVIEAMTHQIPSVVSMAAGITRDLDDGDTALFFPSEDDEVLAEKIRWCINHRKEAKAIGERSYKVYKKKYSMDIFSRNLLAEVRKILSERAKLSDNATKDVNV